MGHRAEKKRWAKKKKELYMAEGHAGWFPLAKKDDFEVSEIHIFLKRKKKQ